MQLSIRLASRSTWRFLLTVTALLAAGHALAMILTMGFGYTWSAVRALDLNEERSFRVMPYAALVFATALFYPRFLVRMPREVAGRLFVAGIIFVRGAAGMELLAGRLIELVGFDYHGLPMELEYLVEETLEMVGASYFLAALLRYVELRGEPLVLTVALHESRCA